jgi:hypothetical protein
MWRWSFEGAFMGVMVRGITDTVRTVRAAADASRARQATISTGPMPALGDGDAAEAIVEVRAFLKEFVKGQARLAAQVEELQRGQEEMMEFVRSVLDDEAMAAGGEGGHRRRVAVVSLRVAEADEVVRGLVGAFCDGIGLEVILQAEGGSAGRGPYLAWRPPDGRRLEDAMATTLAAVPDDQAADHPGLDELRRLLLALHEYGPGTIRIGPAIFNRTPEALTGRVASPWELAPLGATGLPGMAPGEPWPSTREAERWLRGLGGERAQAGRAVVELTAWANGYLGHGAPWPRYPGLDSRA